MKNILYILSLFFLMACNKEIRLADPETGAEGKNEFLKLVNKQFPAEDATIIETAGTYTFVFTAANAAAKDADLALDSRATLDNLVKDYNTYNQSGEYKLLPEANYQLNPASLKQGATSAELHLDIRNLDGLAQGFYVLPLRLTYNGESALHIVKVFKDAAYTPLSATSKKPMPPGTYNCPTRTEPMRMVAYVETNNWDIRNMGQFVLKNSRKPVFDYVVIFAANMNWDAAAKKRYLSFNSQLQPLVRDPKRFIQPLKDRGIKVIADILPNNQGVGFRNFQNYEEALVFARECKEWADKLGLDGFDLDEEYAAYGTVPERPVVGTTSTMWFMRAMKEVMPDKLLTLYEFGHGLNSNVRDDQGKAPIDYFDFSWSDYNVTGASQVGMPSFRYGNRSLEAARTSSFDNPVAFANTLRNAAQNNINACNGYHMIFNFKGPSIKNGNVAVGLSYMTKYITAKMWNL